MWILQVPFLAFQMAGVNTRPCAMTGFPLHSICPYYPKEGLCQLPYMLTLLRQLVLNDHSTLMCSLRLFVPQAISHRAWSYREPFPWFNFDMAGKKVCCAFILQSNYLFLCGNLNGLSLYVATLRHCWVQSTLSPEDPTSKYI